ncbi:MAG: hypothetical protein WDO15_13705 [Bacteroidota bacterium]
MANGKVFAGPQRDESYMMSAEEVADHVYFAVVRRKRDVLLTVQGRLAVWLNYSSRNGWIAKRWNSFNANNGESRRSSLGLI